MNQVAIELKKVSKRFGEVVANNQVDLKVYKNEILSLLGENGSGKTTLMNMISGIYFPDSGEIEIDGKPVVIKSPRDAHNYKIGMIHQHFKLVDVFSAADNILLGEKMPEYSISQKAKEILENGWDGSIQEVAAKVGYDDAYHFSKLFKKRYGVSPSMVKRMGKV